MWFVDTDGRKSLHTLLQKHFNDLLERQSSKWGKDEVSYFYVGDVFCMHLGTLYANFQETSMTKEIFQHKFFFDKTIRSTKTGNRTENRTPDQPENFMAEPV